MSITSSNNLSVNNSLTVNGNTVLGSHLTSTLLINATSTIYNGLTVHGNIVQNSGSLSTGTDNVYLNGDVIIQNNKTLTTSIGTTTNNGLLQCDNNIYVLSGKSLYITDAYLSKYLGNYHDGTNAYIDYTGNLILRNSGTTTSLSINSSNNQATFNYNLNTNGITNGTNPITNNSTLSQVGAASFNALSATSINNSGSYGAISCTSISNSGDSTLNTITTTGNIKNAKHLLMKADANQSIYFTTDGNTVGSNNFIGRIFGTSGQMMFDFYNSLLFRDANVAGGGNNSALSISATSSTFYGSLTTKGITNGTNAITNNATLNQNSTANINSTLNVSGTSNLSTLNVSSDLNVTGLPYFIGTSANFPSSTTYSTSKNGLEIYWNIKTSQGDTAFLNHSAGGSGGFNWWTVGIYHYRSNLMYLDDARNLSLLNNISCESVTATGNVTCASLNCSSLNLSSGISVNAVTLNSQSIYSVIVSSEYTANGSNAVQKFLPNNGLAELYILNTGSVAVYLPQSPSSGTKLTFRRTFTGSNCFIYSYNGSATVLILDGQTTGTNILSITSPTSATFVYYSGNWYQT